MAKADKWQPADLEWLAKQWEGLLGDIVYPSRKLAIRALCRLTGAYLRGQGKRIGNAAGFNKHGPEMINLQVQIVRHIAQHDAKDLWFPKIMALGLDWVEQSNEMLIEMGTRSKDEAL